MDRKEAKVLLISGMLANSALGRPDAASLDSRAEEILREIWGGADRGACLQVTAAGPLRVHAHPLEQVQEEGFLVLTMEDAAALHAALGRFVRREAARRQELLRAELERLKLDERTVFHEILDLKVDDLMGDSLTVEMVSRLCPKVPKGGVK